MCVGRVEDKNLAPEGPGYCPRGYFPEIMRTSPNIENPTFSYLGTLDLLGRTNAKACASASLSEAPSDPCLRPFLDCRRLK